LNVLAIPDWHRFREGPFHHTFNCSPLACAVAKADGMLFDSCVRSIDKQRFEIRNVPFNPCGVVSIGPLDLDVSRMTFMQPQPLLVAEPV
jgi:hypothetical protein